MHQLLLRTPCRIVLASPYDVLGEVRQPNLPGTTSQYPNWRIPLPLSLEDLTVDARMKQMRICSPPSDARLRPMTPVSGPLELGDGPLNAVSMGPGIPP